jgi:hypothetical protein
MELNVKGVSREEDGNASVSWIFINLWQEGHIIRKINYDGERLELEVYKNCIDRIEFEFLKANAMLNSGISATRIDQKLKTFSKYKELEVDVYGEGGCLAYETMCFSDNWDEENRPHIDVNSYFGVKYVKISLKDPEDDSDYEPTSDSDEEEREDSDEDNLQPEAKRIRI